MSRNGTSIQWCGSPLESSQRAGSEVYCKAACRKTPLPEKTEGGPPAMHWSVA
jgi:hypothetical protein